ncbi:phosphoribosyltransferase [Trinickia sp. LjRoot230]|uniref:phosphoribosyltransferase n=1 Tax=Trinickia sp. LjRoot230 TaxID=3342288 RepID=UPI003ECD3D31
MDQPNQPILPITYDQIDQWIASLQPVLAREGFACVVGILRGGTLPATLVSHATGVVPAFLRYQRATRTVSWDASIPLPAKGSKVLLCEDFAGSGHTLADCVAYLREHGLVVKTLTVVFDDLSRSRPDYGIDCCGYRPLLPWERHVHTQEHQARWRSTQAGSLGPVGEDHEFAVYAIDLDGILLPDVPPHRYEADLEAALKERDLLAPYQHLPDVDFARTKAIVTGRPEIDRPRTSDWLRRHGYGGLCLMMRDPATHGELPEQVAAHKAQAAVTLACTHFIESDPVQAIFIAQHAPQLRVVWWDAARRAGKLIASHAWQTLSTDQH